MGEMKREERDEKEREGWKKIGMDEKACLGTKERKREEGQRRKIN
jgi:hypothetical protein